MSSIKLVSLIMLSILITILTITQIILNSKIKKIKKEIKLIENKFKISNYRKSNINNEKNNRENINIKSILIISIILLILILIMILPNLILLSKLKIDIASYEKNRIAFKEEQQELEEKIMVQKDNNYNNCLIEKYNDLDNNESIKNKINEINSYIRNNYSASILYEDITTGFTYKYNAETVYYGASLIKLVAAMYLIDKDNLEEEDIENTTIKYTYKYISDYSTGMKTKNIFDDVTLKELISYAVTYSDNTAYCMLIDYIGEYNLINYAHKLGATKISLTIDELFGPQNTIDTNIYLHHAYDIINNNKKYGNFLKTIMLNNDTNALNLTGELITAAHKYGMYDSVYHDIGIIYEDNPYYISILTNHGNGSYISVVNNIHRKVNELHHLFHQERQNRCYEQFYNNK